MYQWNRTDEFIQAHNSSALGRVYQLAHNEFSHLGPEYFIATHTGEIEPPPEVQEVTLQQIQLEWKLGATHAGTAWPKLAGPIDYRVVPKADGTTVNAIGPVRDQKICGSCYIFAVVAQIQAFIALWARTDDGLLRPARNAGAALAMQPFLNCAYTDPLLPTYKTWGAWRAPYAGNQDPARYQCEGWNTLDYTLSLLSDEFNIVGVNNIKNTCATRTSTEKHVDKTFQLLKEFVSNDFFGRGGVYNIPLNYPFWSTWATPKADRICRSVDTCRYVVGETCKRGCLECPSPEGVPLTQKTYLAGGSCNNAIRTTACGTPLASVNGQPMGTGGVCNSHCPCAPGDVVTYATPERPATQALCNGCSTWKVSRLAAPGSWTYTGDLAADVRSQIYEHVLRRYGPFPVAIYVTPAWKQYKSGLLVPDQNYERTNHAVLLMGCTSDTWIIRNSWGEYWGVKGHAHIPRVVPGITSNRGPFSMLYSAPTFFT